MNYSNFVKKTHIFMFKIEYLKLDLKFNNIFPKYLMENKFFALKIYHLKLDKTKIKGEIDY